MTYTGIGSRKTPADIYNLMTNIASKLAIKGYTLRSGGAVGADTAFESGAILGNGKREIFYAKDCTPEAKEIAGRYHPYWDQIKNEYVKQLHGRNAFQVLGRDLITPSNFVICWTPDGCTRHVDRSKITGGTGTAISIADAYGIPVYNLYDKNTSDRIKYKLEIK